MSFFSTTFWRIVFSVFTGKYTRFLVTHPLLAWGWGQKLAKFAVFLVAKILKMHIFFWLFWTVTSTLTTSKTKKYLLGLCPKPHSLVRPQGRWQPYPPTPTVSVGSIPRRQGVKCTTSSPLTLSISVGVAKLTEADGAGNLSRLAKKPRSGLAFTGWRRPNALW